MSSDIYSTLILLICDLSGSEPLLVILFIYIVRRTFRPCRLWSCSISFCACRISSSFRLIDDCKVALDFSNDPFLHTRYDILRGSSHFKVITPFLFISLSSSIMRYSFLSSFSTVRRISKLRTMCNMRSSTSS